MINQNNIKNFIMIMISTEVKVQLTELDTKTKRSITNKVYNSEKEMIKIKHSKTQSDIVN